MRSLSIDLRYAIEEIARLQGSVGAFAEPWNIPRSVLNHFMLAIEEIVSNVIVHGADPLDADQAAIKISLSCDDNALSCEIIDGGAGFDPFADAPEPDLSSALDERRLGGLGVHIVKRVVDAYSYERRDNRNHIVLIKKIPRP